MFPHKAPETPCLKCGKIPPLGFALIANELVGDPILCTKCLFDFVSGKETEWKPFKGSK